MERGKTLGEVAWGCGGGQALGKVAKALREKDAAKQDRLQRGTKQPHG